MSEERENLKRYRESEEEGEPEDGDQDEASRPARGKGSSLPTGGVSPLLTSIKIEG